MCGVAATCNFRSLTLMAPAKDLEQDPQDIENDVAEASAIVAVYTGALMVTGIVLRLTSCGTGMEIVLLGLGPIML